jgi:hypothetical protein
MRVTAARAREIANTDHNALMKRRDSRDAMGRPPMVPATAKAAIEYLLDVEDNVEKACAHAGLKPVSLRIYLQKTHVRNYLNEQRRIRIDVARAGNVPALVKVRDHADNAMAVVGAVKTLEQMGAENEQTGISSREQSAGITIVIETPGASAKVLPPVVDVEPEPPHHWPSVD